MKPADGEPQVGATLEAIDATLAGEPVDPAFAEIAELALLVRAERPTPGDKFVRQLDARIERRFADAGGASGQRNVAVAANATQPLRGGRRWRWSVGPAIGVATAALVAVVVLGSSGGTSSSGSAGSSAPAIHAPARKPTESLTQGRRPSTALGRLAPTVTPPAPGLHVPNNGRKQIQSSQLTVGVVPKRIDAVAQEVFNVVGAQNGFVDSSQVTAGSGGYGHFQLMVPSVSLPQTMSELSSLRYATVLSRTDKVEDVTSQYRKALKHHNKRELKTLQRRIAYSQVTVTIQADPPPPPHRVVHHRGFSIGSAAHTALHVLTVIGGIALIALAVLVPITVVATIAWWIAAVLKRKRRERALDLA